MRAGVYGEASQTIYDDLDGVAKVTTLPDDAPHRNVDKIVLQAGTQDGDDRVKTAIVCPPTIYGRGRGPGNQRSHQVPELARAILERGYGVQVGAGKTLWGNVHVHDLSDLYLKLVENAAAGGSTAEWEGKPALWGSEGYYFCENGEHEWGEVSRLLAKEAFERKWVGSEEVRSLSKEEADACTTWGSALWGANSRARAKRARVALKWEPKGASLEDEIGATLEVEARALGVTKGHAVEAAGDA